MSELIMRREAWMAAFTAEFRLGTKRGTESAAEYAAWLRSEAEGVLDLDLDPVEEAREALHAISATA